MRFLADENFNNDILRGLKQEAPEADIIRIQDTVIYQADDPTVLAWAAQEGRIVLTHDVKTMPKFAYERVALGLPMAGIIEIKRDLPIGQAVAELLLILGAGTPADFENQVRYIPLR